MLVVCFVDFYGTVLNAREFLLYKGTPPPPRAPLSSSELLIVASFGWYDRLTYFSILGYVVSL